MFAIKCSIKSLTKSKASFSDCLIVITLLLISVPSPVSSPATYLVSLAVATAEFVSVEEEETLYFARRVFILIEKSIITVNKKRLTTPLSTLLL